MRILSVQLVDSSGKVQFKTRKTEPFFAELTEHLPEAREPRDTMIPWEAIARRVDLLHAEVRRRLLSFTPATGGLLRVKILKKRLRLDRWEPAHDCLLRLSALYVVYRSAFKAHADLSVLVIPDLDIHPSRFAWLAKASPEGIERSELLHRARADYRRLSDLESTPDELKRDYERYIRELSDESVVTASVCFLEEWGLVTESEDGRRIFPTKKLLVVSI